MRKLVSVFCVLYSVFCVLSVCPPAQAVWIFDPKTGKWTNPKYAVKGSAKAQLDHAKYFENDGKWERAAKEYKKLVKAYPTSPLAPIATIRAAENYKKSNFYYEAYQSYQMIVEKYPNYADMRFVVDEEYKIGNLFLSGKRRKLKFIKLALFPSMDIAIEIFQKVVENFPYGDLADKAQLRLGMAYVKKRQYAEAIEAYKKILKDYKTSPLRDEAQYRMGLAAYKQSKGPAYDQAATDKALEYFKEFVREYPQSKRLEEVKIKINELNSRKSRGLFEIAAYYDKVGEHKSAVVYYAQVLDLFPESQDAKLAKDRLAQISHQTSTAAANSASSASSDSVGHAQRTVEYASHDLGRLPRIQSGLDALETKSDEKSGLAALSSNSGEKKTEDKNKNEKN